MRLRYLLPLVLLYTLGNTASADQESAETLALRMNGKVSGMEVHSIWAPDDSALYIQRDNQVLRIDTASGTSKPMIDPKALAKFIGSESPRIERFAIADNGDFICLVTTGNDPWVLRINDSAIDDVDSKDNPFASLPSSADQPIRSQPKGGETAVIFFNNTDNPVQIFWADTAGLRQPYATVESGQYYRQHTLAGHAWVAGNLSFVAQEKPSIAYLAATPKLPERQSDSKPRGKWSPIFRNGNLFVKNLQTDKETQLTSDGTVDWKYCGPASESPDGRYLMVLREKAGEGRHIDLIEAAPIGQLQPRKTTISYPKPGDRIDQSKPHLFDLQTMKEIPVDDALFPNPWNVDNFHWAPDGKHLFFIYNQRGHQIVRLLAIEASSGNVTVVAEEQSDTFIDYNSKIQVHHLDRTDEAIWMSERSGWNHLYLVDRSTGKINPITKGEWVVRGIERIDEDRREILFRAGGIVSGMDPYYIQYARVSFDGSNLTLLTEENGTHTISFSPKGGFYVDSWSRSDLPPVHALRRYSDGKLVAPLGKADAAELLEVHPYLPEPFCAKGRDGETDIYGVIFRPSDLDPKKKYPVIESIYAGPHGYRVPKEFSLYHKEQRLAEIGFIVVRIDGMGTNWRSKKFHDVCWKNLKDAGFPDRMAWMKAAAIKHPYMDLDRVGIYGSSAGGQNAMRAVIDHAGFYKAAYADCGCHDNRMDKIWWNELWMGWPVDESYIESSNLEDAHKLGGKLMLTVGAMDSNVDPASTMQVVDELIKANKEFELMVFPSAGHGAGMGTYGTRLREDFFIRHLQP